jgi:Triosephosphate isomerase
LQYTACLSITLSFPPFFFFFFFTQHYPPSSSILLITPLPLPPWSQVHAFIRSVIAKKFGHEIANKTIIQYGGSVKPDNVKEIMSMPDIDGCLVGGASLDAASFAKIVRFKDQ